MDHQSVTLTPGSNPLSTWRDVCFGRPATLDRTCQAAVERSAEDAAARARERFGCTTSVMSGMDPEAVLAAARAASAAAPEAAEAPPSAS